MKTFLIIITIILSSCTTTNHHGIIIDENDIKAIKPQITRMEDVKNILGTPSFIWKEKWHYISTTVTQKAFFKPKIIQHNAYVIAFKNKTVSNIQHYDINNITHTQIKKQKIKFTKPNLKEVFE